jgi:hypothetical protein
VTPSSAVTETIAATFAGPIRVTFTDGTRDAVPAQTITAVTTAVLTDAATDGTLVVTQAPSSGATVSALCGGATAVTDSLSATGAAGDDGAILGANVAANGTITCTLEVTTAASAGTYKGTLALEDTTNGNTDVVTISWSFTTTGKVATLSPSVTAVSLPAIAATADPAFVVSKSVTLTLKDSAGATTQPSTGDTVTYAITGTGTNIAFAAAGTASGTLSNDNLADGSQAITVGSVTAVADSETVTFTPAGVMPAQGVAAATLTATTTGYGVETGVKTVLASPTVASVVAAGTAAGLESSYKVDPSNTSYAFDVSGYTAGAAYRIGVLWTDASGAGGTATVKDDTSNTTAASLTSATIKYLYGITGATGTVRVTVVATAGNATADTIKINPQNANTTFAEATDSLVTNADSAYAATITTPAVTPSMVATGAVITVAGKIADQYLNPLSGASIAVTGTVTTTDTTPANLTGTATSAADGTWSVTLSAATALTTSVSIVAAATKTGATISSSSASVVNLTASGSPASMTWDGLGNEDTFTTLSPLANYPATVGP